MSQESECYSELFLRSIKRSYYLLFFTDLARELKCSIVVEVGGQKIGIMGYLTPETKVS